MTPSPIAVRHRPSWDLQPPRRLELADLPASAGTVAAVVGIIVLLGWVIDADALRSMFPGSQMMKANTALCFVLIGTGLVLVSRTVAGSRGRRVGVALVGGAVAIAMVSGSQYLLGRDFGLDLLLFPDPRSPVGTMVAGRMSPLTAICLGMLGGAIFLTSLSRARRLVISLAGGAIVVSVLVVFAYLFGASAPSFLKGSTLMSVNTVVTISALGVGVIGLLEASPFASLAGRSATAQLLRRLLAISIVVPALIGWLGLEGERLGLYDTSYGTSLMTVSTMAIIVGAILHSARWARRLEMKRDSSELERDRFFDLSPDMLAVLGADGRFRRVNRAWETSLGYPPNELVGQRFLDLIHPGDLQRTIAEVERHNRSRSASIGFQNRYRHRDDSYRWLEWTSQTAPDGSLDFAIARDITDRKRGDDRRAWQQRVLETRNEALSEDALRDPLTGLHNRRYFDATVVRLEHRWSQLAIDQRPAVSVVMFDLDHFGRLNKQHGHQAGDAVLRVFAGILKKRFRESDVVARYGGEEFVAILEGATSDDAVQIAEAIRAAFELASVAVGGETLIRATVSAGCAQLDEDRDIFAGLSVADVWLAQAKRAGRNQVVGLPGTSVATQSRVA